MSALQELAGILKLRIVQLLALLIFITGVGSLCFITKLSVLDPDVWWHLSVGNWIVQNRAFPHTGIFSRTAAARPWMAYSWGFEVLLSRAYDWFGFMGIALFGTALTLAVALALFWMMHRLSGRFWLAWTLSIPTCFAFLFNIMPRPVFFTMMLFAITMAVILKAQQTGRVQVLYWLPFIFLLWANLHIQFIYGIFAVGLFAGINVLQRGAMSLRVYPDFLATPILPAANIFAVLGCCVLATCIGPYSYHLYEIVFGYSTSKIIYTMLAELQPLSFAGPSHFVELFLAASGFLALGWRKRLDPFKVALLIAACIFAFRTTRDAWFLCIVAAAILADFQAPEEARDTGTTAPECAGLAVVASFLLFLVASNVGFNSRDLDLAISGQFPVDAVNFLRRNPVPGPLYNVFDWGGFLIFYMPQYPVAIDGRTDLYGDQIDSQFFATENAEPSYLTDAYLNEAGVVILKNTFPLALILPTDRRFRVIYRDDVATVLSRN
ncbi:MAG TPA: hypothetical protein VMI10_26380 [Terriglobales bacterium]|nr:hypothetical protein [Terriglobales bacterium]